jgi:hypothetical protein
MRALAIALLAACLVIASCGDGDGDETTRSTVTADQFEQIPLGVAEGEIRYELGHPVEVRDADGRSCLDYPESKGDGIGRPRMFRFCFRNGELVAKAAY